MITLRNDLLSKNQNRRRVPKTSTQGQETLPFADRGGAVKHGQISNRFTKMRKKIWAEVRVVERKMRMDELI